MMDSLDASPNRYLPTVEMSECQCDEQRLMIKWAVNKAMMAGQGGAT